MMKLNVNPSKRAFSIILQIEFSTVAVRKLFLLRAFIAALSNVAVFHEVHVCPSKRKARIKIPKTQINFHQLEVHTLARDIGSYLLN